MKRWLNTRSIEDYREFLRIKSMPSFSFRGREAEYSDDYASGAFAALRESAAEYEPSSHLFDYQADIAATAIRKKKYAVFADCGLGKTLIILEYARHALAFMPDRKVLIVCPLMVAEQTAGEHSRFYPEDNSIEIVRSKDLAAWLASESGSIGITNYEALKPTIDQGNLGALILDESSMLKSHYGRSGAECIRLGKGLGWKLCLTGTPAPNDRIEYANHAVFLDRHPTVNSFLARYFINRGQTQNRWELKPHAIKPFYRSLSHWSIFLTNPAVYGWSDNCGELPPIRVHIEDVPMTESQRAAARAVTGDLFALEPGGITQRGKLSKIAKGLDGEATLKYEHIRRIIEGNPEESVIVWCWYDAEQDRLEESFPDAASVRGATPHKKRLELIADFKAGHRKVLISKPKVLGFGLNLQIATRQIFSSLIDSYESYYQAVKRSNRYGSTKPLDVHIPVTEIERPMIETVLRKADRVNEDTKAQEELFRESIIA